MKTWKNSKVKLATNALRTAIEGKRIALMMNTSAIDNEGRSLIDVIASDWKADVAFFFGMEHGVRGNLYAADSSLDAVDKKTGIPIVNLYDFDEFLPPAEEIAKVEAVVFCAQDTGVRHWTYTPWLLSLMGGAATVGTEVIVLDRPNPIRGDIVEGAPCEHKYEHKKLLTGFPYPLRHGMTVGELAIMYNETANLGCNLTVLQMEGYRRDMWYRDTGLIWMPPSPNIPTDASPLYFAATGLLQASNISYGIGTTTPFQYIGAPWIDGEWLADKLNSLNLPGVFFVSKYYQSRVLTDMVLCDGVMIVIEDENTFRPVTLQLHIMDILSQKYGKKLDLEVDKVHARCRMGTDKIIDAAQNGTRIADIIPEWERGADEFKKAREKYLLYK